MKIDHKKDKGLLLTLCDYLFISKRNLKKDELGYWRLIGRKGYIDTDGEYWYARIECKSSTTWKNVKNTAQFMQIWQDGDDEGALRLLRYPSKEEAQIIRKIWGFTHRRELTPEQKERLFK